MVPIPNTSQQFPKRVFCFFAHPDDESYSVSGTIAQCVKNNAQVWLTYATRGEAGHDYQHGLSPGPALGEKRTHETQQACKTLGVQPPLFLDLPDGNLSGLDGAQAEALLDDLIKQIGPHLVLGLGPDGAYGHKDHLCCYRWLDHSVSRVPARLRPRCLWAAFPKGIFAPLHKKLQACRAARFIADIHHEDFGVDENAVDLRLDVSEVLNIKRNAMACHKSQLPTGKIESFMLYPIIESFFDTEMFVHAHGKIIPAGASSPIEEI